MSGMHLVRGMSSLNNKKRKAKKKAGWREAEIQHEKWLRARGCHPDQLKTVNKEFKEYEFTKPFSRTTETYPSLKTSDTITGSTAKTEPKQYTGDYITGLATMHKSNTVPVGRGCDPKEYAQMRRN